MKRPVIYLMRFALAFVSGLACLLGQPAVWAQNITASPDLDSVIQAVMEVQDRHTDHLLAISGVVGTATTMLPDGQIAVKVLTRYRDVGRALPAFLEGMPVVVEEAGDIHALAFTRKYDPVPVGVSIGNENECAAGTHGAVVVRNQIPYILSNNHVLARENNAAIGEDILQPGRRDSIPRCDVGFPNPIADLTRFKRITFGFLGNNRIDAAIAAIKPDTAYTCATQRRCGYTPGTNPVAPILDMRVKKCGRTTMLTKGKVTGVNVAVLVSYGGGKMAVFTGQTQFNNISRAGDSGSLIVTDDGTDSPVALLFAGSETTTIGNPIGEVLDYFGVSVCGS